MGIAGTMGNRWNAACLLLLSLKVFGMKEGDPDAPMSLQCYQLVPSNIMNCSWFTQEPPDANTIHVLYYESLKLHPGQTHTVQAPSKQNWVLIERSHLTQGDSYHVWVETKHSMAGTAASTKLHVNLDEIVKPPPPDLESVVLDSFGATVTWKNPLWSESLGHQPLTCALRYKTSTDHSWTYLSEEHVGQEGHDLEDLKPFTLYEVQAQCIPEKGEGFWSEWSSSQTFRTPEAAPLGQVDVWQEVGVSKNGDRSLLLLWKALDPEAARGTILDYEVVFQDHNKNITKMVHLCCSVTLPHTADCAWVSARNSVKKTQSVHLSFEKADLPGPEEVQVLSVEGGLGLNVTWKPSVSPLWVPPEEYVVEWREEIPSNTIREFLDWTRRPGSTSSALLTGSFRPKVPYLVCVYALYAHGTSASDSVRAYFKEEAPSDSPQVIQDRSISSTISLISWKEIPLADRNGHVTHYTLYLKHPILRNITIDATERSYSFLDLKPGTSYQLWMTGSTSAGEGVPSPLHHFHTPDSHWQHILVLLLVLGFLVFVTFSVVLFNYRWVLSFCHKILPPWCWEKIPDPGHSSFALKIDEQRTAPGMDALNQCPAKSPEETDIVEIKEPVPQQTTPPAPVEISGYEKHFMPTQEELQRLS
ncbi:interleukin-27 receptor subunit alpha isoform X2 [Rhineura floridana]|nr:interleukin-27 receptor subunit alpha isoform X2 [Rhineura floridana]